MTPGERLVRDWLASIGACVEFELGARPGLDLRGLIGRIDGAIRSAMTSTPPGEGRKGGAMSKFTPGPWEAELMDNDKWHVVSRAYSDEEPEICGPTRLWGLSENDAYLIAAAPTLLEVAEAGLLLVETQLAMVSHGGPTRADGERIAARFRAALAKARGEA